MTLSPRGIRDGFGPAKKTRAGLGIGPPCIGAGQVQPGSSSNQGPVQGKQHSARNSSRRRCTVARRAATRAPQHETGTRMVSVVSKQP
ncbi:hypothetical protein NL676_011905 [Syzygium grande]|nr:hypothetical protein NL676_011905 [Syzygium grande]